LFDPRLHIRNRRAMNSEARARGRITGASVFVRNGMGAQAGRGAVRFLHTGRRASC